jgi:transcriptional regulator with XRE-family HTH domain
MPSTDKRNYRKRISPEAADKLRHAIQVRLKDLRISEREASRRAGFNPGYVGDILEGRSKTPDAERVLRLVDALDLDGVDLLGDSAVFSPESRGGDRGARPLGEERRGGGRSLPLYAAPLPINVPFLTFEAEPVGRVPCPAILLEIPDAYAVTVPNGVNTPRYFPGEIVYPFPGRTPKLGDFVFIRCKDGTAGIARLEGLTADSAKLQFLGLEGDDKRVELPFANLDAMHPIVISITP